MMEFKTSEVINCESRELSKKAEGPVWVERSDHKPTWLEPRH